VRTRGPNLAVRHNPYRVRPHIVTAQWPDGLRVTYCYASARRRDDYAALLRQWGCYVQTSDARPAP